MVLPNVTPGTEVGITSVTVRTAEGGERFGVVCFQLAGTALLKQRR